MQQAFIMAIIVAVRNCLNKAVELLVPNTQKGSSLQQNTHNGDEGSNLSWAADNTGPRRLSTQQLCESSFQILRRAFNV